MQLTDGERTSAAPSRAFGCAALLAVVALLPGLGYVLEHASDTLAHRDRASWVTDLMFVLAIGALGPLAVAASTLRMMRRADRPVALFVLALALTSVPTLLYAGLATFGPDNGGIVLGCLLGLVSGALAALVAIAAAIRQRRARSADA